MADALAPDRPGDLQDELDALAGVPPAGVVLLDPADPARAAARKRRRLVPPGLLRPAGAAEFCAVGRSTWDRWSAAGLTPAPLKIGGAVFYSRAELAEWCRRGCPPRDLWRPVWAALLAEKFTK